MKAKRVYKAIGTIALVFIVTIGLPACGSSNMASDLRAELEDLQDENEELEKEKKALKEENEELKRQLAEIEASQEVKGEDSEAETKASDSFSRVVNVTWNNSKDEFDPLSGDSTVITFSLFDGSNKNFDMGLVSMVEGMEEIDIDNDGVKEYVIHAYFVNTAGENYLLYIFKNFEEKGIEQIYPDENSDLTENAELSTISLDGRESWVLNITRQSKEDGNISVSYERTLYFDGNSWREF